jgi:glycosyltransferase involved in cell wall biosynthesis
MRVGQNPAKFVKSVAQPSAITVTVVSCIPFLSGYYEHNLEVLRECILSLHRNRERQFDLMVFDNHSCREVRGFLIDAYEKDIIQYLVLSGKNIGKIGAWNYMFGAAQGQFVAFCDSDVLFRPGWLSASLDLFDRFPNVGMVTGRPTRTPKEYLTSTINWASKLGDSSFKEGCLLDWETYAEHSRSLGLADNEARKEYDGGTDYLITYDGKSAFAGASHFQFIVRRDILDKIFPMKSEKPMRGEPEFDKIVNDLGYLRLSTVEPYVLHMGNSLPEAILPLKNTATPRRTSLANIPFIRAILLRLYGIIFHIYFNNVD